MEHSKLSTWLDMMSQKLHALSSSADATDSRGGKGEDKSMVEATLREAQSLHAEIIRKRPELSSLLNNCQVSNALYIIPGELI